MDSLEGGGDIDNLTDILCDFPLLGSVRFTVQDIAIRKFCLRQLCYYNAREVSPVKDSSNDKTLKASVLFEDAGEVLDSSLFSQEQVVGRGTKVEQGTLHISDIMRSKALHYKFSWQGSNLNCEVNSRNDFLVKVFNALTKNTYDKCHLAFYELILSPIAVMYYLTKGAYVVHANMMTKDGRAILCYGLDGVGKSEVTKVLAKKSWAFCSDNLCFFDGKGALGLCLPIRDKIASNADLMEMGASIQYQDANITEYKLENIDVMYHEIDDLFHLTMTATAQQGYFDQDQMTNLLLNAFGAPETLQLNRLLSGLAPFRANAGIGEGEQHKLLNNILGSPETVLKEIL